MSLSAQVSAPIGVIAVSARLRRGSLGLEAVLRHSHLVLVADDDGPLRRGVRLVVESAGYQVLEAATTEEFVSLAREYRPEVCLVEPMLSGGGLGGIRRVFLAEGKTKIVVLTGSSHENDVLAALRAGAIGYLVKGTDDQGLAQSVAAAIRGEAVLPRRLGALLIRLVTNTEAASVPLADGRIVALTPREAQVVACWRNGLRTKEIAAELGISPITVRRHISTLLDKLDAPSRGAALAALGLPHRTRSAA